MKIRPSFAALNSRGKYAYKSPSLSVDHLVVGGGVVGLAVARRILQVFPGKTTSVVERHEYPGQETRFDTYQLTKFRGHPRWQVTTNGTTITISECVLGLYYPGNSLKTQLCIRGRHLLYNYCEEHGVPYQKLGKLVVAHEHQLSKLESLQEHIRLLRQAAATHPRDPTVLYEPDIVPRVSLLNREQVHDQEPDLSPSIAGALLSSDTGIIDSHYYMQSLEQYIAEHENGDVAYSTNVVRVDPSENGDGWVVQLLTQGSRSTDAVHTPTLINASGLSAHLILNSLRPEDPIPMYYAKGSYVSYHSKHGAANVKTLLYPIPEEQHSFASLGTHLTLDMQGNVRFGPDLEWIEPPEGYIYDEEEGDWWEGALKPQLTLEHRREMHKAITSYLPGVEFDGLQEDYCGIRPKLIGPGSGFQDFAIRSDRATDFLKSQKGVGKGGKMISLLGIESPGLTSSLALAEQVAFAVGT